MSVPDLPAIGERIAQQQAVLHTTILQFDAMKLVIAAIRATDEDRADVLPRDQLAGRGWDLAVVEKVEIEEAGQQSLASGSGDLAAGDVVLLVGSLTY
jgi:hypothetical protein